MMVESGALFTFNTHLIAVKMENNSVENAIFYSKSGIFAVEAKVFIDCTGDGDLSFMAGAEFEKGDEDGNLMPGTLCSIWNRIDWSVADRDTTQKRMLEKAIEDNVFSVKNMGMPGIWKTGDITGGGNLGHAFDVDPNDEVSLTDAFIKQRKILDEYKQYFRDYLTGFDDIELITSGNLMGIRESRRIMGDYKLTLDDFNSKAVFDDEIGRYCYTVDIHEKSKTKWKEMLDKVEKYCDGDNYGIPYRTLTPKGIDNILVAGKCISCDRYILGSVRVMPGCFITGQAAGTAASIMVSDNCISRLVNIKKLQKTLKENGAFLPNFKE